MEGFLANWKQILHDRLSGNHTGNRTAGDFVSAEPSNDNSYEPTRKIFLPPGLPRSIGKRRAMVPDLTLANNFRVENKSSGSVGGRDNSELAQTSGSSSLVDYAVFGPDGAMVSEDNGGGLVIDGRPKDLGNSEPRIHFSNQDVGPAGPDNLVDDGVEEDVDAIIHPQTEGDDTNPLGPIGRGESGAMPPPVFTEVSDTFLPEDIVVTGHGGAGGHHDKSVVPTLEVNEIEPNEGGSRVVMKSEPATNPLEDNRDGALDDLWAHINPSSDNGDLTPSSVNVVRGVQDEVFDPRIQVENVVANDAGQKPVEVSGEVDNQAKTTPEPPEINESPLSPIDEPVLTDTLGSNLPGNNDGDVEATNVGKTSNRGDKIVNPQQDIGVTAEIGEMHPEITNSQKGEDDKANANAEVPKNEKKVGAEGGQGIQEQAYNQGTLSNVDRTAEAQDNGVVVAEAGEGDTVNPEPQTEPSVSIDNGGDAKVNDFQTNRNGNEDFRNAGTTSTKPLGFFARLLHIHPNAGQIGVASKFRDPTADNLAVFGHHPNTEPQTEVLEKAT